MKIFFVTVIIAILVAPVDFWTSYKTSNFEIVKSASAEDTKVKPHLRKQNKGSGGHKKYVKGHTKKKPKKKKK